MDYAIGNQYGIICAQFSYYQMNERPFFRYLHEIIPTKKKLKDIRSIASSVCEYCIYKEKNTHVVYQYERYKDDTKCFKGVLQKQRLMKYFLGDKMGNIFYPKYVI